MGLRERLSRVKERIKALGAKIKEKVDRILAKIRREEDEPIEIYEERLEEALEVLEEEEVGEEEVGRELADDYGRGCPEGEEEVQDVIFVWDDSYEERKKHRVHEISLYVYVNGVARECLEDQRCLDELAVRVFDTAVQYLEGGALESLLRAALTPLNYSIDMESAIYCDQPTCLVESAEVSINTRGKFRAYRSIIGVRVC